MGKLAGIATGRQVRKEVIDSRRILASLRQETGLDCTDMYFVLPVYFPLTWKLNLHLEDTQISFK